MRDENLVDFVELRLKSKEDFCFRHNASSKSAGLLEILFFFFTTWRLGHPALHKAYSLRNLTKVLSQKLLKDFIFNN